MTERTAPDKINPPATRPCGSCPYRTDTPSGVWAAKEYDRLPDYDGPTFSQPVGVFLCHQQDGRFCAGWVACHDMTENLGLRMAAGSGRIDEETHDAVLDYTTDVEIWESGAAAAEHGKREIEAPSIKATKVVDKLITKHGIEDVDHDEHVITLAVKP